MKGLRDHRRNITYNGHYSCVFFHGDCLRPEHAQCTLEVVGVKSGQVGEVTLHQPSIISALQGNENYTTLG